MSTGERIRQQKVLLKLSNVDIANAVGVTKQAVGGWLKPGARVVIKGENLVRLASYLGVSEAWLTGESTVKDRVKNMRLVRDEPDDEDVPIPQYQDIAAAAGTGVINNVTENPTEYVTFKRSWITRKGFDKSQLCVIYADGESMADRVQSGDVVLVDLSDTTPIDGRIYVFIYSGMARLKRIQVRATGAIILISDNDPDGTLREEITPDTFDELRVIGRAVWVGGDLK